MAGADSLSVVLVPGRCWAELCFCDVRVGADGSGLISK